MFIPSNSHPIVIEALSCEHYKELLQEAEHHRLLRTIKAERQPIRWFQLSKLTLLLKQLAHFHPVFPTKVAH